MPRPTVQAVGLSLVVSGSWPELPVGQESAVQSWALVFRRQRPVLGSFTSLSRDKIRAWRPRVGEGPGPPSPPSTFPQFAERGTGGRHSFGLTGVSSDWTAAGCANYASHHAMGQEGLPVSPGASQVQLGVFIDLRATLAQRSSGPL